ncbi:MAG: hypothetical protein R3E58_01480 [Phycisphaerae bacterium]
MVRTTTTASKSAGQTSADGGRTWSAPATLLTDGRTSGADDESPVIVTDGSNWVVGVDLTAERVG